MIEARRRLPLVDARQLYSLVYAGLVPGWDVQAEIVKEDNDPLRHARRRQRQAHNGGYR